MPSSSSLIPDETNCLGDLHWDGNLCVYCLSVIPELYHVLKADWLHLYTKLSLQLDLNLDGDLAPACLLALKVALG